MKATLIIISLIAVVTIGTGAFLFIENEPDVTTVSGYLAWLNDPENGLTQTKYINGISLTAKLLPPEYLAYQEISQPSDQSARDSLVALYNKTISFLLIIGSDERDKSGEDIMWAGTSGYEEYVERLLAMNFNLTDCLKMHIGEQEFLAHLSSAENTYGLGKSRNIIVTFTSDSQGQNFYTANEIDLVYTDEIFKTGINHFTFSKNDISNIPSFPFN